MLKKYYTILIIAISLLISSNAIAISTTSKSVLSDDIILERIQAYSGSSTLSKTVGIVEEGTQVIEHKTFTKTKPGIAIMEERPKDKNVPFDRGAHVYIWEYLEDGFSKVIINNIPYTTKIARSKTECDIFPPSPKYCWATVIEEPEYYEWKQISLKEDSRKFWILNRIIDGSGIISIKDKAVNINRIVSTKRISTEEVQEMKKEGKEIKDGQIEETDTLFDPALLDEIDMPKDPMARKFVENMLKPKSQREKEKKQKKLKEKQDKKQEAVNKKKKEDETRKNMFKQQKMQETNLQTNLDNPEVTALTIKKVNKQEGDTVKLNLKPNKMLVLEPTY